MTKLYGVKGIDIAFEISDSTFKPYRKKPTLAIKQGNEVMKVASFNNEGSALFTMKAIEMLMEQASQLIKEQKE